MIELQNSNCKEKTQSLTNLKNLIVTKLKNSNCNNTQFVTKLQTHIATKLPTQRTYIATKLRNLRFDKIQQLKIMTNPKISISDTSNSNQNFKLYFSKNNVTPQQLMRCTLDSVFDIF